MARALRIEYEGAVYHVTARGNERRKIFFCKRDYDKFKEYMNEAKEKYRFLLNAYVLMTNHYCRKEGSALEMRKLWHKISPRNPSMGWRNGKVTADRIWRGCRQFPVSRVTPFPLNMRLVRIPLGTH
jgi:hypothetical protein